MHGFRDNTRREGLLISAATPISTDEYPAATYRPGRELLERQLVEPDAGEYDHSNLQGVLLLWIGRLQRDWNVRVLPTAADPGSRAHVTLNNSLNP